MMPKLPLRGNEKSTRRRRQATVPAYLQKPSRMERFYETVVLKGVHEPCWGHCDDYMNNMATSCRARHTLAL